MKTDVLTIFLFIIFLQNSDIIDIFLTSILYIRQLEELPLIQSREPIFQSIIILHLHC